MKPEYRDFTLIMKVRYQPFLHLFFLSFSYGIFAQYTPQEEAIKLFEEGNYTEALPVFKRLTALFPKDPRYQYYTGVCMVQLNTDLKAAVSYLSQAAEKPVPRNVYFFLGKAWHYQYQFDKALDEYLRFQQFGERTEKYRWQCDMHIAMARNGKRILERECNLNIYQTDTIFTNDLFSFYNKRIKGGKFQIKTERGFLFSETKTRTSLRFIPSWLDKNQAVYESALGTSRKNRDIVLVRKLENDEWSRPENLGSVINSPYDEDYAYFNSSEPALYFASKGHNSMGGYDIFKSVFNSDTKTWSQPVNLGYPINTPYDDFLFVPSDDQTQAMVASNRATQNEKLVVYTFSFARNYAYLQKSADTDFLKDSNKGFTKRPTRIDDRTLDNGSKDLQASGTGENSSVNHYPLELLQQKEYNYQLNKALQYQLQSDSVSRLAEDIRMKIANTKNESEKENLRKENYLLEQKSKSYQGKADELYSKVRTYELLYAGKTSTPNQSLKIPDDKVKNALKIGENSSYSVFSDQELQTQKATHTLTKSESINPVEVIYEFKVMNKSPYTSLNQIPLNQPLPEGLLYRVQMGAFSKQIEPNRFKGIVPISGETLQNGAVTKYYAGLFSRFSDVEKAMNRIRELGFRDCYIVSFFDGKSIPVNRAKEIEKDK